MNNEPQFTFEQLYQEPFTKQRDFDHEQLCNIYVPRRRQNPATGIGVLDAVCRELMLGHDPAEGLCQRLGLTPTELGVFLRVLTGMSLTELRHQWRLRLSDELLRYTSLTISEVARRAGFVNPQHYSRYVRRHQRQLPSTRRRRLRQSGDEGKFML